MQYNKHDLHTWTSHWDTISPFQWTCCNLGIWKASIPSRWQVSQTSWIQYPFLIDTCLYCSDNPSSVWQPHLHRPQFFLKVSLVYTSLSFPQVEDLISSSSSIPPLDSWPLLLASVEQCPSTEKIDFSCRDTGNFPFVSSRIPWQKAVSNTVKYGHQNVTILHAAKKKYTVEIFIIFLTSKA